jgi:hypothetical protein
MLKYIMGWQAAWVAGAQGRWKESKKIYSREESVMEDLMCPAKE